MGTFVVFLAPDGTWHYRSISQWHGGLEREASAVAEALVKHSQIPELVAAGDYAVFACAVHATTPYQAKKLAAQYYKQRQLELHCATGRLTSS